VSQKYSYLLVYIFVLNLRNFGLNSTALAGEERGGEEEKETVQYCIYQHRGWNKKKKKLLA